MFLAYFFKGGGGGGGGSSQIFGNIFGGQLFAANPREHRLRQQFAADFFSELFAKNFVEKSFASTKSNY